MGGVFGSKMLGELIWAPPTSGSSGRISRHVACGEAGKRLAASPAAQPHRYTGWNMIRKILLGLCMLSGAALGSDRLQAQEIVSAPGLALTVSAGVDINPGRWTFEYLGYATSADIEGHSVALDCVYGPLSFLRGNNLFVSAQAIRGDVSTDRTALLNHVGTARYTSSATAGLLYLEMRSHERLSPFVRAGAGAAYIDFTETYSNPDIRAAHLNYWGFTYAYGAGINYVLSNRFGLSLCYEGMMVPGRHKLPTSDTYTTYTLEYWADEWVVLRLHIKPS